MGSSRISKVICSVYSVRKYQKILKPDYRLTLLTPVLPKVADVFAPLFDDPAGDP
jgi:hypothetical protein